MSDDKFTIYYAGDLFDHKHLCGNALLAASIERESNDRYHCILPQDLEQTHSRAVNVRNQDLYQVMECDLALFNFDGADLDSGTVVEFMLAKFLDIPAVILRSDFRRGGDQGREGDDWNLMCSFYPRTRIVQFNGMDWYQHARQGHPDVEHALAEMYRKVALQIVEALDEVRAEPPLLEHNPNRVETMYRWALRFPGSGFYDFVGGDELINRLLPRKRAKGLIP